jgi:hypothetical protein
MLIESTRIRDLLNVTVTEAAHSDAKYAYSDEEREELHPPRQYSFSMNPIPALVILLLGSMMSSHTQGSMLSSMVHKQWGNLLTGASLARALTYMIMYLKPPKSVLPSRPPTELLTAFGLISGGIIFMASVRIPYLDRTWMQPSQMTNYLFRVAILSREWPTTSLTQCSCTPLPWALWDS